MRTVAGISRLRFNGDSGNNYSWATKADNATVTTATLSSGIDVAQTSIVGPRYFSAIVRNVIFEVLGGLGESFAALQWHGDTFGIPAGGVLLAGSDAYPHQAFRAGAAAYGVQFHVEVTEPMLRDWQHVPAYRASAGAALGPDGFRLLAEAFSWHQAAMTRSAPSGVRSR